jgi:hypothetical protein
LIERVEKLAPGGFEEYKTFLSTVKALLIKPHGRRVTRMIKQVSEKEIMCCDIEKLHKFCNKKSD